MDTSQISLSRILSASHVDSHTHPMGVKKAWDLAARLHENLGDKEARQRCLKAAVDQTLAMRDQVKGSAAAEAGWINDALLQLRHIDRSAEPGQQYPLLQQGPGW